MYKKILVPLDGSPLAEAILPHARALAQRFSAEIALLRVQVFESRDFVVTDPSLMASLRSVVEADVAKYLKQMALRLSSDGFDVTTHMGAGPVADVIVDLAASEQADLIAMSTHGRSGFSRWVMGSVAEKVVQGAQVPVLLIRPHETAE